MTTKEALKEIAKKSKGKFMFLEEASGRTWTFSSTSGDCYIESTADNINSNTFCCDIMESIALRCGWVIVVEYNARRDYFHSCVMMHGNEFRYGVLGMYDLPFGAREAALHKLAELL